MEAHLSSLSGLVLEEHRHVSVLAGECVFVSVWSIHTWEWKSCFANVCVYMYVFV